MNKARTLKKSGVLISSY